MFHKEGYIFILTTLLLCISISILTQFFIASDFIKRGITIILLIVFVLVLQFFRNPKRNFTHNSNEILSPVDGKVVVIEEVFEKEYFKEKRIQISVFMSPINVHVTRYPISGNVILSKYHPGKYLVAWNPKSSEENERTTVVVRSDEFGDILHRQIAGAMAKRIVNYAKVGQNVEQSADSGFIKFGSRVDVFLPLHAKIDVSLNQRVIGGISVLAHK